MDKLVLHHNYPKRSFLYAPEPIGRGTGMVEGLASYIMRLARCHHVSTPELLRCIAAEMGLGMPISENWGTNLTQFSSRRFNGMQTTAMRWSRQLTILTRREQLAHLTLLPWRELVTARQVLHISQWWCPMCLQGWRQAGTTIYWPLLWSIRNVQICPQHQVRLVNRCHGCQRQIPALNSKIACGLCPRCGVWLGQSDVESISIDDAAYKLACRILQMLALGQTATQDVTLNKLSRVLLWCQAQANCRQIEIARGLEMKPYLVYRLLTPKSLLNLNVLFQVLDSLGVTLTEFAHRSFDDITALDCVRAFVTRLPSKQRQAVQATRIQRGRHATPAILLDVERRLQAALQEQDPPSLNVLARDVGLTTVKVLRQHFPEMCREIVCKRYAYFDLERFRTRLQEANANGEKVTLKQISAELKTSPASLRKYFPEEVAQLVMRQQVIQDVTAFRAKVAQYLERDPPLTLTQTAADMGIHPQHIRNHCPQLRRAIVERHVAYRQAQSQARKAQEMAQVCELVRQLHAQWEYPTKAAVGRLLQRTRPNAMKPHENVAFAEEMERLGL